MLCPTQKAVLSRVYAAAEFALLLLTVQFAHHQVHGRPAFSLCFGSLIYCILPLCMQLWLGMLALCNLLCLFSAYACHQNLSNTHQTAACCCVTHQLQEWVAAADCGNGYVCNAAGTCALPLHPGSSCSQDGEACTWQCIAVWLVLHVWHFTSQSICNTLQDGLVKCWMLYAEA